ncbi:urea ABC transporter permease subunit UrtB [Sulfurospirillum arcachonense]|uniref:urea ABC transporter permease subunit UrtB n=1 Tax=Sulfurospirillum arcachonense TaxID=57666 RepID=UPI000468F4E1|nr:urea ABC transporter permease subunit UrtB [Sulfurospirillum arcachonense]
MKTIFIKIILLNLLLITSVFSGKFENDIKPLLKNSFKTKEVVINQVSQKYSENDKLQTLLQALMKGDLFYTKQDKTFVVLYKKEGKIYYTKSLETQKQLEPMNKKMFKKVKTNNRLRSTIREKLAELNLFSKDRDIRYNSAKNMLKHVSQNSSVLVQKALKIEKDSKVLSVLNEINTIINVKFGTDKQEAIVKLGDYLSPQSLQALKEIYASSEDKELKELARLSIASINRSKDFYAFVEKAFFGLSLGSILLLAAIGLAITFGVMKVINMAHGEMMMLGAYTVYALQKSMPNLIEYSVIIAIPVAFLVSGIIGIIIERLVIRHLYGRPLETLLATFGISLILQQMVRSIFSPLNQEVKTPQWMSGALEINSALSLTYNRLYIIIFALLVFAGILLVLNKTSLGLKVRAVTQNRKMAQAMGIKTGLIDALTFGIGSGIAGIAGVALSQLTNVGPNLGQAYIVDSFMVVVFGGVGNLWGTLIGAITLGEINKFIEPVAGAVLAKVIILVFIILFIQKRPRGLFAQKGRDAED